MIAPEHTRRHQVIAGTSITKEGWFVQACDAGPGGRDGAAVHISKDKGKTWTDPWDGAPLPDFKEGRDRYHYCRNPCRSGAIEGWQIDGIGT